MAELTEELSAAYAAAEQAAAAVHASYRKDLVPVRQRSALVVWKPRDRR
jgi:MerR family transcriptional regulator/heat shock protein HspR